MAQRLNLRDKRYLNVTWTYDYLVGVQDWGIHSSWHVTDVTLGA